jgi:hypothetical protein
VDPGWTGCVAWREEWTEGRDEGALSFVRLAVHVTSRVITPNFITIVEPGGIGSFHWSTDFSRSILRSIRYEHESKQVAFGTGSPSVSTTVASFQAY